MIRPPLTSPLFPYTTLFRSPPGSAGRPGLRLYGLRDRPVCRRAGHERQSHARSETRWLSERATAAHRSEEHTSELQSLRHLVCRLLLEKKKKDKNTLSIRTY